MTVLPSRGLDSHARRWLRAIGLAVALLVSGRWAEGEDAAVRPAAIPLDPNSITNQLSEALLTSRDKLASPNLESPGQTANGPSDLGVLRQKLELARNQRLTRQTTLASSNFVAVLASDAPESLKRTALLELALTSQDDGDLPKAQQILAQYLARWPEDAGVPEVLLRQGLVLRQMGLNNLALTKFYAVMTSSLVLKNDQVAYYQGLVLQAQTEIAETFYREGKNQEAVEFFERLLKQNSPALVRPQVQYKLVRSLAALTRNEEVVTQAEDFLSRYPDAVEQPEVRFFLASALKRLGRNGEALEQVLLLLREQQAQARQHPQLWAYWQQRAGNEIANQLYREGDYPRALEVYLNLAQLDASPAWQLPVWYQVGMSYEHLEQPAKAIQTYDRLLRREAELGTNATPGLKAVLDMARWRRGFLGWETNAEVTVTLLRTNSLAVPVKANPGTPP